MRALSMIAASMMTAAIALTGCSRHQTSEPTTDRVEKLLAQMTLEEKLGQLNLRTADDVVTGETRDTTDIKSFIAAGRVGAMLNVKKVSKLRELQRVAVEESRLGIPLLFGMDVIHGHTTIFPIPLALSCSWDTTAIRNVARISAREATASGIDWTYSPMVDISRDPRWGRMAESAGEDPFLGSCIARVMVQGYQGSDMTDSTSMMACVKHFACYGGAEAGKDYNTVDMSRVRMYNEYLPPYRAGAEAGAGSFMTSFNTVDYVPATGNKWLLTDVLRGEWGFDGFVVTDYSAIYEMIAHGMGNLTECAARAMKAGADMDMMSNAYIETMETSLKNGDVDMADIDRSVRRVLMAKERLGLFDNPYLRLNPDREATELYTAENRAEARRIAAETFVLLKNEGNLLPLQRRGTIALVGPLADAGTNMAGMWSVTADFKRHRSLLQAFKDALGGNATLLYAKGANIEDNPEIEAAASRGHKIRDNRPAEVMLAEAVAAARRSDVVVAALGETAEYSGEAACRSSLTLPESQMRLLRALVATGKPIVLLNFSGRATLMNYESEHLPAIMNVWFGGSEGADAMADVVFGDAVPSGRLTVTIPHNMGQIPIYHSHLNTGRPMPDGDTRILKYRANYLDGPNAPLYPFGYGLSYTTFSYSDFRIDSNEMTADGSIRATVTVTNTGRRKADEVVQLYIRDLAASIARPVKELKGFRRITLEPGQSMDVEFTITADLLKFYNSELNYVCEPGEFDVMAGPNSANLQTLRFTLR